MTAKLLFATLICFSPFAWSNPLPKASDPQPAPPIVRNLMFRYSITKVTATQNGDSFDMRAETICEGSVPAPIYDYRNYPDSPGMPLSVDQRCQTTVSGQPITIVLIGDITIESVAFSWTPPDQKDALTMNMYALVSTKGDQTSPHLPNLQSSNFLTRDLNANSMIGAITPDKVYQCQEKSPGAPPVCSPLYPEFFYINFETSAL